MIAAELYKLVEAAQRLLNVGGEIIDLCDGRRAIALPVEIHPDVLEGLETPSRLERELMASLAKRPEYQPS